MLRAPPLAEVVQEFLRRKEAEGVRRVTVHSYRWGLHKLTARYGQRRPYEIQPDDLESEVAAIESEGSRAVLWRRLVVFFGWCLTRGYTATNPAAALGKINPKPSVDRYVLTPEETHRLLRRVAKTPELPFWVLSLFGGLRSREILALLRHPLRWSLINRTAGRIDLPATMSKRGSRIIVLLPVLRRWLEEIPENYRPISRRRLDSMVSATRSAVLADRPNIADVDSADEKAWNIGRRTYVSYRLALPGASFATVAQEVGNTEGVLRHHYAFRMERAHAEAYFALTPERVAQRFRP